MDSQKQRKALKQQLQVLQQSLIEDNIKGKAATQVVELDQSSVGRLSRMDAMQGQAMALENERRRIDMLKRIENTLKRIDTDDFGYCDSCGEAIAIERLKFDATARLCITCANYEEKT